MGTAVPSFPDPNNLPPLYVDERLVEPETRQEMLDGRLIPPDGAIEDPTLVYPVPVRTFFDRMDPHARAALFAYLPVLPYP